MRRLPNLVADAIGDGAEDTALDASGLKDRGHQIRRRRLAVRARDADDPHLLARVAEELGRENRECRSRILHLQRWNRQSSLRLVGDDGYGAAVDSLPDEDRTVGMQTLERDKHVAGRDMT